MNLPIQLIDPLLISLFSRKAGKGGRMWGGGCRYGDMPSVSSVQPLINYALGHPISSQLKWSEIKTGKRLASN